MALGLLLDRWTEGDSASPHPYFLDLNPCEESSDWLAPRHPGSPAWMVVSCHHTRAGATPFHTQRGQWSVAQLADFLRPLPLPREQGLLLISCYGAASAAELARLTGRRVVAADQQVTLTDLGHIYVSNRGAWWMYDPDGGRTLVWTDRQYWLRFGGAVLGCLAGLAGLAGKLHRA